MRPRFLLAIVGILLGCGDPPGGTPAGGSSSGSGAPPGVESALAEPSGTAVDPEDETSTRPVELLKLVFAADVKDREPSGPLQVAKPGQKVYAHLTVRNRSGRPRKIRLNFTVDGEKRTSVELFVGESWSWRTWAYNTVLPKDAGKKLALEVTD